jgi:cytochrome P450
VTGNGLLTSEDEVWKRQRRLVQPAFHSRRLDNYALEMVDATTRTMEGWQQGQVLDLHPAMTAVTLEIVAKTLFGADVRGAARQVGRDLEILMAYFANPLYLFEWGQRLPTVGNFRLPRVVRRLDAIIAKLIDERRREGIDRGDLLSRLLSVRDDDGSAMDEVQIRDELITLFLAGHETTALALTYAVMLIAANPTVQAELQHELATTLAGRPPLPADIPNLRLTEAIVKEAMRLYPPAWTIGREVVDECKIGGYLLPPGAQVICAQWVVHRDGRFFSEPLEFRPQRWLDGSTDHLPRCAYFPFGDGPRICIGQGFAMMEAVLILATMASRFTFAPVPGKRLELVPSITLRPRRSIFVRLKAVDNRSVATGIPAGARLDQPETPAPVHRKPPTRSAVPDRIRRHTEYP